MDKPTGEEIIEFINTHWTNQSCPMCGNKTWNITDKIFELREFNNGDLVVGGPDASVVPVIPIICDNCGNTVLINVVTTHLLKKE